MAIGRITLDTGEKGLHLRTAAKIVELTQNMPMASRIEAIAGEKREDARSMMGLLSLGHTGPFDVVVEAPEDVVKEYLGLFQTGMKTFLPIGDQL